MISPKYSEKHIKSLDWREHIRLRPGMYIGKLGDGSSPEDGIYVLFKEIIDNCIDEHIMGFGKKIECTVNAKEITVRDYGRGIPLGKVIDCVSKINTGGKYDGEAFQKSVGLNGVGTKAVNALSEKFQIKSFRDTEAVCATFKKGNLLTCESLNNTQEQDGTHIVFRPDEELFENYAFDLDFLAEQIRYYTFLNPKLSITLNGKKFISPKGLVNLLQWKVNEESEIYPYIQFKEKDIEIAFTHRQSDEEKYFTFVNGQFTSQGGTHLNAFREAYVKSIRNFFDKNFDALDIRAGIVVALSIRIQEPIFESQTKTKLGSIYMQREGVTIRSFVNQFLSPFLDDFLHRNKEVQNTLKERILHSQKERKDIASIKKIASTKNKKVQLHNKKLRDCKFHLNDKGKNPKKLLSTLFITEGDSASGSITKARNSDIQAVFSLRGKPLNTFGMSKKVVYQNEEFYLLQNALNIENGIENLRYQNIIISTDADVDGMHIRLLLITFFLQFFLQIVKDKHLFILETPLFRVRNPKKTIYCYSEKQKEQAERRLTAVHKKVEITRFKGLGEISPEEFEQFIGDDMHTTPVFIEESAYYKKILQEYMGKNTQQRQEFIIQNLRDYEF